MRSSAILGEPVQRDPGDPSSQPVAYDATITAVDGSRVSVVVPGYSERHDFADLEYLGSWPRPGGTAIVVFNDEREPLALLPSKPGDTYLNAEKFGYLGDGTHNDTAAIVDGLDALPPYTGGVGGGTLVLPPTPSRVSTVDVGAITQQSGQRIVSGGMQALQLLGNGAGDVLTVAGDYCGLEDIYVRNAHADAAARAMDVTGSNFAARRAYFQAACAGGEIVRVHGGLLAEFEHCKAGGAGTGVCDVALLADGGSNVLRLIASSFTDAKSGVAAWGLAALSVNSGCHFESLAGGGTYDSALAISGVGGGAVMGNYFEATPGYAIAFFATVDYSSGVVVGGNNMQTPAGGSFIDLTGARKTIVLSNDLQPGGSNPNPKGVLNTGTYAHTNTVFPQHLASGTGLEVDGGVIDRAGPGSPEGAISAYPGSTWHRTDGGASTSLYVKTSGTGNTGWTAK